MWQTVLIIRSYRGYFDTVTLEKYSHKMLQVIQNETLVSIKLFLALVRILTSREVLRQIQRPIRRLASIRLIRRRAIRIFAVLTRKRLALPT